MLLLPLPLPLQRLLRFFFPHQSASYGRISEVESHGPRAQRVRPELCEERELDLLDKVIVCSIDGHRYEPLSG